MSDFVIERDIDRSPADVFAYVVDADKLATWQRNTVSAVPDGPIAVGAAIVSGIELKEPFLFRGCGGDFATAPLTLKRFASSCAVTENVVA